MDNKAKDIVDFRQLLLKLALEGKRYGEGDKLTEMMGGEKFSYKTRSIVSEMVDILQDTPELAREIPENLRDFFEGYRIDWKRGGIMAVDDGVGEAIPDPPPIAPQFVTQWTKGVVEAKDMSRRGTRTETARELIASGSTVKTKNIKLEIVDFTDDEDEPAYDVNVYVDGKAVTGGKIFDIGLGTDRALRNAEAFMDSLVRNLVRSTGGTL